MLPVGIHSLLSCGLCSSEAARPKSVVDFNEAMDHCGMSGSQRKSTGRLFEERLAGVPEQSCAAMRHDSLAARYNFKPVMYEPQ